MGQASKNVANPFWNSFIILVLTASCDNKCHNSILHRVKEVLPFLCIWPPAQQNVLCCRSLATADTTSNAFLFTPPCCSGGVGTSLTSLLCWGDRAEECCCTYPAHLWKPLHVPRAISSVSSTILLHPPRCTQSCTLCLRQGYPTSGHFFILSTFCSHS